MRHAILTAAFCLLAFIVAAAEPPATRPARVAFAAQGSEFPFDTDLFRGVLRAKGKSLGLTPVVENLSQTAIAGPYGIFSCYRMLDAGNRYGPAAWDWASQARLLDDGAVEVRWTNDADHPFDLLAVYRWSAANTLDLTLTVSPRKDLKNYELFLASYLPPCNVALVYATPAGQNSTFMPAEKADGDWQMFPRDDKAVAIIQDGRWKRPPNPVDWTIRPRLATPIAIRRDAKSGLTAVILAHPEDCFAIATPFGEEGHRSLYLSLFGRDLAASTPATARARLILGRDISNDQALRDYRDFVAAASAQAGMTALPGTSSKQQTVIPSRHGLWPARMQ
ncbi:MAG: hypothetical protein ABSH20_06550 [Tepidisphaeraceae bacterium]|jgi:hypothetical protein